MTGYEEYFGYRANRANYLTHISRRHRAVFVEVPKAGCTVVKRVLQHSERRGAVPGKDVSVHDRASSPLGAPVRDGFDADELFGSESEFFRFGFVRNPFSRALSCYLEKIVGDQWLRDLRLPKLGFEPTAEVSFVEFLRRVAEQAPSEMDIHWAPQHHLLGLDGIEYSFLGRFECFQADLRAVVDHLSIDAPEQLLSARTTHATDAGSQVLHYFDPESVDLVRHIYRGDFQRLGYGRDPALVR